MKIKVDKETMSANRKTMLEMVTNFNEDSQGSLVVSNRGEHEQRLTVAIGNPGGIVTHLIYALCDIANRVGVPKHIILQGVHGAWEELESDIPRC
jgi:hypothetical protein